jgi:hypothetical protein
MEASACLLTEVGCSVTDWLLATLRQPLPSRVSSFG